MCWSCMLSKKARNNQSNLSLIILSSQPMSTQSLVATPSGYLLHGSYPIVDLSPQQRGSRMGVVAESNLRNKHSGTTMVSVAITP
jgi:hypothetical protein